MLKKPAGFKEKIIKRKSQNEKLCDYCDKPKSQGKNLIQITYKGSKYWVHKFCTPNHTSSNIIEEEEQEKALWFLKTGESII